MRIKITHLLLLMLCSQMPTGWAADIKPVQCPGQSASSDPTNEYLRLWSARCVNNIPFLEAAFSKLQSDFEAGIDARYVKGSSFFMFEDSSLPTELTDGWLKQYPQSYAAHLAKGLFEFSRGTTARGAKLVKETTSEQLTEMSRRFAASRRMLDSSLKLTAKPYLTYRTYIRMGKFDESRSLVRSYFDRASSIVPTALGARLDYMETLQPRWGGSFEQMQAFADEAAKAGFPPIEVNRLRALAWWDRTQFNEKDEEKRLTYALEANKLYETYDYLTFIIQMKFHFKRYKDALPEVDRAITLAPTDADLYRMRGIIHFSSDNNAAAYKDFLVSAKAGNAFSQNKVGFYLWTGKGAAANTAEATQWFAKAAAQGDEDGKKNLAVAKSLGFK